MYSLVLMAALTSAPDTPQFNGYFRDLFGSGCTGRDTSRESDTSRASCQGGCHCHGVIARHSRPCGLRKLSCNIVHHAVHAADAEQRLGVAAGLLADFHSRVELGFGAGN